jgi:S-formylglutathione hydrolase FrmB
MTASWRRVFPAVVTVGVLVGACGGGDSKDESSATLTSQAPSATEPIVSQSTVSESTVPEPTYDYLKIPAPSLDGNRLGDPSEIEVSLGLPASYASEPDRRYPVVYFLAGYDESAAATAIGMPLQALVESGDAPEMIVVAVSGNNALGGSFYVDSPVSGRWATAIVNDLVTAIDAGYRTLATPASRGIAGFSMGGYGALALAVAHPDVFGAVYALSPGLFAPGGLARSQMFDNPTVIADVIASRAELAAFPADEVQHELRPVMARSGDALFSAAYGTAFAPDPDGPAPWIAYPYSDPAGAVDPDVWAQWEAGFGGLAANVAATREQWLALRGIVIDVGTRDEYAWIPPGAQYLHEQLDQAGITNRLELYDGGHGPVGPRAGEIMLPFFAEVLETSDA